MPLPTDILGTDSTETRDHAGVHNATNATVNTLVTDLDAAEAAIAANTTSITNKVDKTLVDAKGDLLVASAADTITRLPVGTDGQGLVADSAQASGLKWSSVVGDPGPAGGSLLDAFWTFNSTTSAPPAAGQMRTDHATTPTTLWVHETDTDGYDRTSGLDTVTVGQHILVRAANGTKTEWVITSVADSGVYRTFGITVVSGSGTVTKGARTQLNFMNLTFATLPLTCGWPTVSVSTSTPFAPHAACVASSARLLAGTAGSTTTTVEFKKNGTTFATLTLTSGQTNPGGGR